MPNNQPFLWTITLCTVSVTSMQAAFLSLPYGWTSGQIKKKLFHPQDTMNCHDCKSQVHNKIDRVFHLNFIKRGPLDLLMTKLVGPPVNSSFGMHGPAVKWFLPWMDINPPAISYNMPWEYKRKLTIVHHGV